MLEWLFGGKKFDPDKDIPNLDGKVILITGGMFEFVLDDPSSSIPNIKARQHWTWKGNGASTRKAQSQRDLSRGENALQSGSCD